MYYFLYLILFSFYISTFCFYKLLKITLTNKYNKRWKQEEIKMNFENNFEII